MPPGRRRRWSALLCLALGCTRVDPASQGPWVQVGRSREDLAAAHAPDPAADAWRRAPGERAALDLARAYFPEIDRDATARVAERRALRAALPATADGALEVATGGLVFEVKRLGATASGPRHFWRSYGSRRVEEYDVMEGGGPGYRAEYQVTVPGDVAALRDAGEYLEFLDARATPVVRLHYAVGRDAEGRSRQGTVSLRGAAPDGLQDGLPRLALRGRTLRVVMKVELDGLVGPVVVDPGWSSTGAMAASRMDYSSTLLPSGKVLVAGGFHVGRFAEVYDPGTGTWKATGSMASARYFHTATLLSSGKVMVAGGQGDAGALASSELYDPATGTWSTTGSMLAARSGHTATALLSGKVLVTSSPSAELYDPASGVWSATGAMATARFNYTATLLRSGKVLVAGGGYICGFYTCSYASMELYDPATGLWVSAGSMPGPNSSHVAMLLPSGKVLIAGGWDLPSARASAWLYDPVAGTWSGAGALRIACQGASAGLLPSGKVIVVGGINDFFRPVDVGQLYDPESGTWSLTDPLVAPTSSQRTPVTVLPSGKVLVDSQVYDPGSGSWTARGSLSGVRNQHTATLLPSGKVLVVGGYAASSSTALSSTELGDPASGLWSQAAPLATARYRHTTTLLPSGKVLVVGGSSGSSSLASAELYDPAVDAWGQTAPMATARYGHTATLLPSGKVLVVGGTSGSSALAGAELYDPVSGAWSPAGSLTSPRHGHTATLLTTGKVLVVGGIDTAGVVASSELYDPTTGAWSPSGSMGTARWGHTATTLDSGKVLVAGGADGAGTLTSSELYDPATGTWSAAGQLSAPRAGHAAVLLPSGEVLVTGAQGTGADLYSPVLGRWTVTAQMAAARTLHTATLLPSGKVLVAGGSDLSGSVAISEVYEPADAQDAWRPALDPVGRLEAGSTVTLTGTGLMGLSPGSDGTSVGSATNFPLLSLRRPDGELQAALQGSNPSDTAVTTTLPANANGHYLLFVTAGAIPGGQFVHVSDTTPPAAPAIVSPANGSSVRFSTPRISGLAEPGSTVTLSLDGMVAGTAAVDGAGNWSFQPSLPLADGPHSLVARAVDLAGNVGPGAFVAFTVDTAAPAAPVVLAPADGARLSTAVPRFSGTAEASTAVVISLDGTIRTAPVDGSGHWSYTPSPALSQGAHSAAAHAVDAAGNVGPDSAAVAFTVDTVAPAAPVVQAPADMSSVAAVSPAVSGTAEPGSTVTISFDGVAAGAAPADGAGRWSFTPGFALGQGPHSVAALATDAAGNAGPSSAAIAFTVDTVAPAAPVVQAPAAGSTVLTRFPDASGTAEAGSTVTVWLDGAAAGTAVVSGTGSWSCVLSAPLVNGSHRAAAQARDAAGNDGALSVEVRFTVDPPLPAAPVILTPSAGAVVPTAAPVISGTARARAAVVVAVDAMDSGRVPVDAAGNWHWTAEPLAAGPHTVTAQVIDGTLTGPVSVGVPFTVASPVLAPEILVPLNGSTVRTLTPAISGGAEPGALVTVRIDGSGVETATADASGAWSCPPAVPLGSGPHQLMAVAANGGGAISSPSEARGFIVSLEPVPAPVVLSPEAGETVGQDDVVFAGTAEVGTTVRLQVDGVARGTADVTSTGAWTFTLPAYSPLPRGPHAVAAQAEDQAGNLSSVSQAVDFSVRGKSQYAFGCSAPPSSGPAGPWTLLLGAAWMAFRLARRPRALPPT